MGQPLIQNSMSAGELSPSLYGRTDFAKYHSGMALVRNFFVDPRGGIINRAGTKYVGPAPSTGTTRLIPFVFSTTQSYALVFSDYKMRIVFNGGYITETAKTITAVTKANPGVVSSTAHGYSNGDTIYVAGIVGMTQLNGRFFNVANVTANTYTLKDIFGTAVDTTAYATYISGGTAARVYTIASPYAAADLAMVKFTQSADVMTLCHPNYAPRELTRYTNTNWVISTIMFGPVVAPPTFASATASNAGATTYQYVVTAMIDNTESRASNIASVTGATLSTTAGANISVGWQAVAGATQYRVYRTREIAGSGPYGGAFFGFVGAALGLNFTDNNIAPNFAISPPQASNPFAGGNSFTLGTIPSTSAGAGYTTPRLVVTDTTGAGAALTANVTAGALTGYTVVTPGSNYSNAPVIGITGGTGAGASANAVVNSSHVITSVAVVNGGSGYTNPAAVAVSSNDFGSGAVLTVTVAAGVITAIGVTSGGSGYNTTDPDSHIQGRTTIVITDSGAGTGAVLTPALTPQLNNPSCCCYYQQRLVFGATPAAPDQLVFSKTGDYHNMDVSYTTADDDSISITIASQTQNAIKSIVPFNSMLALSSGTCWKIDSGQNGGPLTPASVNAIPQSFEGASDVPPIIINYSVLYTQDKQSAVNEVSFSFYQNLFTGNDISVLAEHLFQGHAITEWAWAQEPHKVIWAVREDGLCLTLTYVKPQEVIGWARHDTTAGLFKSVVTIPEGTEDVIYFVVRRNINGTLVNYIERLQSRLLGGDATIGVPGSIDACWFVDAGLQTALTHPAATLTPSTTPATGVVTSVVVVNGGTGYVSPSVTINDPTGTGATATATVSGGVITGLTMLSGGAGYTSPTINITDSAGSGVVTQAVVKNLQNMSLSSAVLSNSNLGEVVRVNGGQGVLYSVSGTNIQVDMQIPVNSTWPTASGTWSSTPTVTTVSGMEHLNGMTVSVVGDGNTQSQKVVSSGAITLDYAASLVTVGLPITAQAKTMPLDTGENPTMQTKRVKVSAVTARVKDSRRLQIGHSFANMYEVKERTFESTGLLTKDERAVLDPLWETPSQVCFQQSQPMPAQLNALVFEISEGDGK